VRQNGTAFWVRKKSRPFRFSVHDSRNPRRFDLIKANESTFFAQLRSPKEDSCEIGICIASGWQPASLRDCFADCCAWDVQTEIEHESIEMTGNSVFASKLRLQTFSVRAMMKKEMYHLKLLSTSNSSKRGQRTGICSQRWFYDSCQCNGFVLRVTHARTCYVPHKACEIRTFHNGHAFESKFAGDASLTEAPCRHRAWKCLLS